MKTILIISTIATLSALLNDDIFQAFLIFAGVSLAVLITALALGRTKE